MQGCWKWGGVCHAVIATGVLLGALAPATAESYPTRTVTVVVPFGPGSVTDAAARLVALHLQEALGQPFVIENKTGAGGLIAASAVAHAAPDGYTLLITTNSTHSAAPALFKTVPYDPIKDFTPVARIGSFPSLIAVYPGLPIKTIGDLVSYAKANPGKLEYGHGNSTGQIVGETLKKRTGIDIVRVAYRSNPAAVTDLIAGHIAMMIPDFNTGLPQVRAGSIRPVAVFTKERNRMLPDIPTLDETVMPGFDILAWAGMFAPANTPPEVVERIAGALQKILSDPKTAERFAEIGTEPFYSGPSEFSDYVKTELVKWTSVAKEAGIEPE
jgi:tripartite-type tricarboxylate transporter receptor subunit TctC